MVLIEEASVGDDCADLGSSDIEHPDIDPQRLGDLGQRCLAPVAVLAPFVVGQPGRDIRVPLENGMNHLAGNRAWDRDGDGATPDRPRARYDSSFSAHNRLLTD